MSAFQRGIAPIVLQAIVIGNRSIQRFVQVKPFEAHDVHVDIRVPCCVWCIHAIEYMDTAPLAKRVMCYLVFALIFRKCSFTGKETKRFLTNLDVPESQPAAETAIAFRRTFIEINLSFKLD
jgi:hypothetical protein